MLSRLSRLEPQLTNYNPSDPSELSKAAEQALKEQSWQGEGGEERRGSLARLLSHLHEALGKKAEEQLRLDQKVKR